MKIFAGNENIPRPYRKYLLYIFPIVLFLLVLFFASCCTFAPRNRAFEADIEAFMKRSKPGSEIELFNGKDLSGWKVHLFGSWTVEDGILVSRRGIGYLATRYDRFEDFILTVEARVSTKGNSGVFFRSHDPGFFSIRPWPVGYEAQIDHHDPKNPTGSLYNFQTASKIVSKDGEWFKITVTAIGKHIQIAVNGETVIDTTDETYRSGFIALQSHNPGSVVEFRRVRLRIPE